MSIYKENFRTAQICTQHTTTNISFTQQNAYNCNDINMIIYIYVCELCVKKNYEKDYI